MSAPTNAAYPASAVEYADRLYQEDPDRREAQIRLESQRLGIEPVSPAVAALLRQQVAATAAQVILEIGTGLGLATLSLLAGAEAVGTLNTLELTTVEIDEALKPQVDLNLRALDRKARSLRTVYDDALQVLPRFDRQKYDLAVIDGDPLQVLDYFEGVLPLVRPGGTVLVLRALADWIGRDTRVAEINSEPQRSLHLLAQEVSRSPNVVSALLPVGDGVLAVTKTAAQ